jgi:predicted dehydrogenase
MKKLRIGFIGLGGIATGAHLPAFAALSDQVELAACASRRFEQAQRVAEQWGIGRVYATAEAMLAQEALDGVVIATPNKYHAPYATLALQAGAHVLCEKPPAMSAAEVEGMIQAAKAAGKRLTFALNNRFHPNVQAAHRFVAAGELGEIYAGRVTAIRRRGIPSWGVFTDKELQGGGPLIDIGVHMLDAALWLMGYPEPAEVLGAAYTKIGNRPPGPAPWGPWDHERYQIEDLANAMIRFANGASLVLESSFAANIEPMEEMNVRLQGTEGGVRLFPFEVYKEMHGTLVNITPAWLPEKPSPYEAQAEHFVAVMRGDAAPIVQMDEALKLQRIIDAIYRSAETGAAVRI